ncbi:hypothetical protein F4779DRAFT_299576 [Xylariaceae sp. FL0662B]|nr:hypothetical protein F4779DRAFT_299576 [Xylariaceae sp. FL0662B]
MSSIPPSSSSSSDSQRSPLHERSNSEKNKLQIRLVPYSPPRPEAEASGSHGPESESENNGAHTAHHPANTSTKATFYEKEGYAFEQGSALSSTSTRSTPSTPLARAKDRGVSGSKLASDSSGVQQTAPPPLASSNIRRINTPSQQSGHDDRPASPTSRPTTSRRDKIINVHSDKTFSVVLKPTHARVSSRSGSSLNTSTVGSHDQISFDASIEDRPISPLSSVPERSVSPSTPTPEHRSDASPWNYRMVGGLRKVPNTPDPKDKGKEKEVIPSTSPPPPLPETVVASSETSPLALKQSFNSEQTDSTLEETTNYKVIGRSSPPDSISLSASSSSSSANYRLLGKSSPAQQLISSPAQGSTDTPGSKNFIVYGDRSPSSQFAIARKPLPRSSDDSLGQLLRDKYSQESLVIPPLRPHKRSSSEKIAPFKQGSKESLRGRANSFSSISSIISQDSASLFLASPNIVRLHTSPSASSIPHSSWVGPSSSAPQRPRMDTHQWSSQLSTVASEYEGSEGGSRVLSSIGSIPGSRGSRHLRSLSSSGLAREEYLESPISHSRSHSRTDSLDRPGPAYMRGARELPSPPLRTVRHHDEHGDGLADLQQLHQMQHKSSRTRLGFSRQSSDRSIRSSSSRAGSFSGTSIPTWARLYYGSGERRWLTPPSIRTGSESGDSRPASSIAASGSPSQDPASPNIWNPRRRPREADLRGDRPSSMEITPAPVAIRHFRRGPRKKPSSIWSPHLQLDHRSSTYSIWNPPSVSWSAESGMFGKRNIQVVLFVVGFLIPFAWMVAAFLPLPPKPVVFMVERNQSTTELGISEQSDSEPVRQHLAPVDDSRYQSARWWRNLNRFMSIAGLLILGAVAALAVIGVRQRWGQ